MKSNNYTNFTARRYAWRCIAIASRLSVRPSVCISDGASSENSPGPGKVLKIFGRSYYRGVFGVGTVAPASQGVRRRSHLNPFAIHHLNPLLHFVNLILIDN